MRIKCPECDGLLSLNQPKPGVYRPTCKHCKRSFRLKVTGDDPPRFGITKLPVGGATKVEDVARTLDSHHPEVTAKNTKSSKIVDTPRNLSEKGSDPLRRDQKPNKIDSPPKGQTPSPIGSKTRGATIEETIAEPDATDRTSGVEVGIASAGTPSSQPSQSSSDVSGDVAEIPDRLGGYKIIRLLGRGAMGSVFEARQISLDRLVALKTIRGRLAKNPGSLARFAREAYAAAQLSHHNIVQIYDFGEDDGRHYFSMEWVRGGPLDQLIREKGALDPKLAAGYALQAARGLQFAHRGGMVHRDIKPANLLLSEDGVIKVADLGLVKIPDAAEPDFDTRGSVVNDMASGTQVTLQGTAVGTPAYMAPEQGHDAATVDHRADIYSLGCCLFCMLTGRPPYEGNDISEVIVKHASEPFPSAKQVSSRVPDALDRIIQKATAKRPDDRYASISEMIRDLESFLGVREGGRFSPSKDQADRWESIAKAYLSAAPRMGLLKPVSYGWTACCVLMTLLIPLLSGGVSWWLLGPAMWVSSLTTTAMLAVPQRRSAVVPKVRGWIGSMSWTDWASGSTVLVIGLGLLVYLGFWPGLILGGLIGGAAAAALHFTLIVPSIALRASCRQEAERFVRDLRLDGADEWGLREFIACYSGPRWPTLFEDLFGYDASLRIREQLVVDPSFSGSIPAATPRDRLCHWLTAKTRANMEARDRRQLARLEERGLAAEGLSTGEARDRAWQIAAAIMENVRSTGPASPASSPSESEAVAVQAKREQMKAMLADARSGRYRKKRDKFAPLKFVLSGQTRLLAGCLLLAWFAIQGRQAGIFDAFDQWDVQQIDLDQLGTAITDTASTAANDLASSIESESQLSIWSIGVAGLMMCMSAFVSGWRMTPFALVATCVILWGASFGIPSIGPLPAWITAIIIAIVIYIPGILLGETRDE